MKQKTLFDHSRPARIGLPESVLCEGKSDALLADLLLSKIGEPVLFTRLSPEVFARLPECARSGIDYDELSRTAFGACLEPWSGKGPQRPSVGIVAAGNADGQTTWEAARTLEYLGILHVVYEDMGVAGLWRLTENLEEINSHQVLIVVAGLDAALASVLGGLTPRPLIALPTSVGYGRANHGETALSCMLASCSPGLAVMNIDNGYGAACAAARIIHLL